MLAVIIADQGIFPTVRTTSFIPNPGLFADGPALGRKGPEPLKNVPPERCILGVPAKEPKREFKVGDKIRIESAPRKDRGCDEHTCSKMGKPKLRGRSYRFAVRHGC